MKGIPKSTSRLFYGVLIVVSLCIVGLVVGAAALDRQARQEATLHSPTVRLDTPGGHGSAIHIGHRQFITAAHVVLDENTFEVVLGNGQRAYAEVLWISVPYDLALVQVLPVASLSPVAEARLDCSLPRIGENVRAIGHLMDAGAITTRGYVASELADRQAWKESIVVDVAVGGGMSGGPLLNSQGHVRGVVVGGFTEDVGALMVAVPSSTICRLLGRTS